MIPTKPLQRKKHVICQICHEEDAEGFVFYTTVRTHKNGLTSVSDWRCFCRQHIPENLEVNYINDEENEELEQEFNPELL